MQGLHAVEWQDATRFHGNGVLGEETSMRVYYGGHGAMLGGGGGN